MKKIFLMIVVAAFIGVNALHISSSKENNVNLNNVFQTAKADGEGGAGTCWTDYYLDTYYEAPCADPGVLYRDWQYVYTCTTGLFHSCTEGFYSYVEYCDGSYYENSYRGEVDCD